MRKDDIKKLKIDYTLTRTLDITEYLSDDDFEVIIDDLEDYYQCKFWEIPQDVVYDAIREYLYNSYDYDMCKDLFDEGELNIELWKPELS